MNKTGKKGLTAYSAHVTSTISVALVLMLLGIIALLGIGARSVTTEIKQNMGFTLVLADSVAEPDINQLKQRVGKMDGVASVVYHSPADALARWEEETGENLIETLGVNPLPGMIEVMVKEDWASTDSIARMAQPLASLHSVSETTFHTDVIDSINNNIHSVMLVLTIVAVVLLFISIVLINNTVRLTIYSRRFLIHTMKLVGATTRFILGPSVGSGITSGFIAGVVANVLLGGAMFYLRSADPMIAAAIPMVSAARVGLAMLGIGIVICALASMMATIKYVRASYDDMF